MEIKVFRKKIKNLYLSICRDSANVKISAPIAMPIETIQDFVNKKAGWIEKKRKSLQRKISRKPNEYIDGENHYFLGQKYILKLEKVISNPKVVLTDSEIIVSTVSGANIKDIQAALDWFYRVELLGILDDLVPVWEKKICVSVSEYTIRKMKTRWGSCSTQTGKLRFNLELAKHPLECIEYVVVHELAHLLEASHNARFKRLMTEFLPDWKQREKALKSVITA